MSKTVLIIGAGMAGLSAGCYAQMNGYQTEILEAHTIPGGCCTAWKRKDYTIDGCVHWNIGSRDGSNYNRLWRELQVLPGRDLVHHEEFLTIVGAGGGRTAGGPTLHMYTDIDRLERHLLELSPVDAPLIGEFAAAVRRFIPFDIPLPAGVGALDGLKLIAGMLPYMGPMMKLSQVSVGEFAQRFTDPFLRDAFPMMFFGLADCSLIGLVMTLAGMHNGDSKYPVGGSLPLAKAVEARYLGLGGKVSYGTRVAEIMVEDDTGAGGGGRGTGGRAVGVRLADGSERRADVVIAACDLHETLYELLGGRYGPEKLRADFVPSKVYPPFLQAAFGVARDLSASPHSAEYQLAEPVTIAGQEQSWVFVRHYGYDPTMAPPGKSVVAVSFMSEFDFWKNLRDHDRPRYLAEKQALADFARGFLEQLWPGIAEDIEVVDVATPATWERYTRTWRASFMAWKALPGAAPMARSKTLPGLEGLLLCGQWLESAGGIASAAASGRSAVALLCKKDGKRLVTAVPLSARS